MVIINADDFGLDDRCNRAIILCFKEGLCSSATLMPNMPAFLEACQLTHENNLLNHVGIHVVLTEGVSLTDKIRTLPKFCNKDGILHLNRDVPTFFLSSSEKRILADEIRAQIKKCRDFGINITHLDSHHHIHTEWAISEVVISVARELHIPYIRISRNCGVNINFIKKIYKHIFNKRLKLMNLARTDLFGSLTDFEYFLRAKNQSINNSFEIMIHPYINDERSLIDKTTDMLLDKNIRDVLSLEQIVSFCGAKYLS
jgi:predicted glycoside hydrolase/deacetylase ChbG (UPF0249 family)